MRVCRCIGIGIEMDSDVDSDVSRGGLGFRIEKGRLSRVFYSWRLIQGRFRV